MKQTWMSHFLREALFRALANGMHKTVHRRAHECLRIMGLEREVEELLYLLVFGVLEVKYDLDRTGMKI